MCGVRSRPITSRRDSIGSVWGDCQAALLFSVWIASCLANGCASLEQPSRDLDHARPGKAHLDFCANFLIRGEIHDAGDGTAVQDATIVFVDTGLGSIFGIQEVVGRTGTNGNYVFEYEYCWGVDVRTPPTFLLNPEEVELLAASGLRSHGEVEDLYAAKKDCFEIWIVSDGFYTKRLPFCSESLEQAGLRDVVDCGIVALQRKTPSANGKNAN